MNKEPLVILVGAGASVSCGVPSTAELLKVTRDALPQLRLPGRDFAIENDFFKADQYIWLTTVIERALKGAGMAIDFEVMIDVLEQLEAFTRSSEGDPMPGNRFSRDYGVYGPVMTAFTEISKRYELLADPTLLYQSRMDVIRALHQAVGGAAQIPSRESHISSRINLAQCFLNLSKHFQLIVFNLNYDDLIDDIDIQWNDGYVNEQIPGVSMSFSARNWRECNEDRDAQLLMHMHGSVRFGFGDVQTLRSLPHFSEPVRYRSHIDALATLDKTAVGAKSIDGQILDGSAIISGRYKAGKLISNPRPYGYYYRTLMNKVPHTKRLLIMGYGGCDEHFNTWIDEHVQLNEDRRSAVVCHRAGKDVAEESPQTRLLRKLAGTAAWNALDADGCSENGSFQWGYGASHGMGAVASGINRLVIFQIGVLWPIVVGVVVIYRYVFTFNEHRAKGRQRLAIETFVFVGALGTVVIALSKMRLIINRDTYRRSSADLLLAI